MKAINVSHIWNLKFSSCHIKKGKKEADETNLILFKSNISQILSFQHTINIITYNQCNKLLMRYFEFFSLLSF